QAYLVDGPVEEIRVEWFGEVLELPSDPLLAAVLTGYLRNVLQEPVNEVNAQALARRLGIALTEVRRGDHGDFSNLITVTFRGPERTRSVAGTLLGRNRPRIVRLDDYHLEVDPEGEIFLYSNDDRPGIVGKVGTLLGDAQINIAQMAMGRDHSGGTALGVLNTDGRVPDDLVRSVEAISGILWTRRVRL
ncbi:MAG: ACT domain-containing protein, partial [Acidobacteriota bacterium]